MRHHRSQKMLGSGSNSALKCQSAEVVVRKRFPHSHLNFRQIIASHSQFFFRILYTHRTSSHFFYIIALFTPYCPFLIYSCWCTKSCEKCKKKMWKMREKLQKSAKIRKSAKCECNAKKESKLASHHTNVTKSFCIFSLFLITLPSLWLSLSQSKRQWKL